MWVPVMTPPLVLPCDSVQLAADVVRLWPAAAEARAVDPIGYEVLADLWGLLDLYRTDTGGLCRGWVSLAPALEELARSLEGVGYAIGRPGTHTRRVLGWAATPADPDREPEWTEACALPMRRDRMLVRICDLPPSDSRRVAYNSALLVARNATEGPEQS